MRKFLLAALVALPLIAQAQPDPKFGGCFRNGSVCLAPAVSLNLLAMSLKTGDLMSTIDPSIGYGVTFFADRWYKIGFSLTGSFPTLEGKRRLAPAGVFSFAEYGRLGLDCPLFVRGGFPENGRALVGFGSDFGAASK